MRIVDLQRRLREVGRIRIGQRVDTGSGKSRPAKLEQFRLTSRDRVVIEAAAERWGGVCQPWEGAPDGPQWEVYTSTDQMPVVVPPGDMAFSQAYEQWAGGGCKVRCDGQWDHLADKACHCDPEDRECSPHSRLSVILPDLPGMGVWRLDTQGYYAAVELAGLVDLIASHSARGVMLPARLRLEQRSVKRQGEKTKRFAVPVLDIDVHPLSLAGGAAGELGTPVTLPGLPAANLTPVPVADGAGAPSIAEQVAAIDEDQPRAARANAAAPIPSTGIKPRTARDAEALEGIDADALGALILERLAGKVSGSPTEHGKAVWKQAQPKVAEDGLIYPTERDRVMSAADEYLADLAAMSGEPQEPVQEALA